ncbi:MAG TPA: hypothetical protein VLX68_01605 [Chitinivibrionales bacterium]|nr:hypothetical protein [Chitinivibrionales bacterium]
MACMNLQTKLNEPGCLGCKLKEGNEIIRKHINAAQIEDGISVDPASTACPVAESGEWEKCIYFAEDE